MHARTPLLVRSFALDHHRTIATIGSAGKRVLRRRYRSMARVTARSVARLHGAGLGSCLLLLPLVQGCGHVMLLLAWLQGFRGVRGLLAGRQAEGRAGGRVRGLHLCRCMRSYVYRCIYRVYAQIYVHLSVHLFVQVPFTPRTCSHLQTDDGNSQFFQVYTHAHLYIYTIR